MRKIKNILVLAPHTDDGELGAGGTISKFIEKNCNVYYVAFSTAEKSVPSGFPKDILKTEVVNATSSLGIPKSNLIIFDYEVRKLNYFRQNILEDLIQIRNNYEIDTILTPSVNDIHQDHSTVTNEAIRAFKNKSILAYELIWNNLEFKTQCYNSLNESHINSKINALKQYKSQGQRDYLNEAFIKSLAFSRGVQFGVKYAEAFEVIRYEI